jgi:hypothetical protein
MLAYLLLLSLPPALPRAAQRPGRLDMGDQHAPIRVAVIGEDHLVPDHPLKPLEGLIHLHRTPLLCLIPSAKTARMISELGL